MSGLAVFRDFFHEVEPIKMKEPLAETLGAFERQEAVLEYSFIDAVKLAGHACPSVAGAFLCCQSALSTLYDDETPVRGNIRVTVFGDPDEGALGVMAQVCTFITGAALETGFKGLGPLFKRKDLLRFETGAIQCDAACFRFERVDMEKSVLVRFHPDLVPFPGDKGERLASLMKQVISGRADAGQRRKFQDLWMERIELMIIGKKEIGRWLEIEEVK